MKALLTVMTAVSPPPKTYRRDPSAAENRRVLGVNPDRPGGVGSSPRTLSEAVDCRGSRSHCCR
jgi:hypothetical protein